MILIQSYWKGGGHSPASFNLTENGLRKEAIIVCERI